MPCFGEILKDQEQILTWRRSGVGRAEGGRGGASSQSALTSLEHDLAMSKRIEEQMTTNASVI